VIQLLAALAVAVWFFRAARAVGKSGPGWAVLGFGAVIAPSFPWLIFARLTIIPALIRSDLEGFSLGIIAFVVGAIGVLFGLAFAYWLHRTKLRPDPSRPDVPMPGAADSPAATAPRQAGS
jgi:hypothetical protein